MLIREMCRILSYYLWIFLIPLLLPFGMAIYCDHIAAAQSYLQAPVTFAFFLTLLTAALLGLLCWFIGKSSKQKLYRREALLLVLIVYFLTPSISALPFYFSRTLTSFTDAYFEATSGLTTTGASLMEAKSLNPETGENQLIHKVITTGQSTTYSYKGTIAPVRDPRTGEIVLTGIEAVHPALLFWRSFTQWLGGGGIIILFVAILPALGVGGKILFQAEMTGPSKETMLPQIKETASHLWKIYLGLTLAETLLLLITSDTVTLFDALTLAFSTLSTGGFSVKNLGIAAYDSALTDSIVMIFMILGSINFSLYFFLMRGKFSKLNDPELKVFLLILLIASLFTTWQLIGKPLYPMGMTQESAPHSFLETFRYAAFQIISTQTSTGFVTANFDVWPFVIQVLMLNLMYVGGMAGSTAGGLKVIRQETFFRILLNKIESIFRPDTVRHYRVGRAIIDNRTATTVLSFFMVAAFLTILGTFLLVWDGVDPETSLTTIACMMNNGGIAFRMGGPTESFAFLTPFGKWLSSIWMIAGRLEFFALLIAFVPAFWRGD